MTQTLRKLVTFQEFVEWKPDGKRYELHDGVIVEMSQPLGDHEDIVGFLAEKFTLEYVRLNLPYSIPKTALVKPPESESGYSPDVLILNRPNLATEPLWKKESTVTQGASIPLVVEVVSQCVARVPRVEATDEPVRVSTNWRDDYYKKYGEYSGIGIPEYWIVDYLALGAHKFIGNPKQPTISVYYLVEGEYQVTQFRGDDAEAATFGERIQSPTFPELSLTGQQIFQAGSHS
ncbi:Uma2 family endonuclease [Brasilonema sp. UFV-L1]|uniref:Uma2 family endonuclease n=1 Tax=Brasilonema sp. UFV-L1 TaxID=2234130 RepID=UPI00145E613B|nr:Uma2 family endonuclease [Brasilonema sp. UFV-L1]NMG08911.1 Uma2 family endonuclease [Brasilonema sp. UFV-L1]